MRLSLLALLILLSGKAVSAQIGVTLENSGVTRPAAEQPVQTTLPGLRSLMLESTLPAPSTGPMVKAYNYDHLAFFCKVEVQLERQSKLQYRFRLGSTDYVDYLEGKRD